MHMCTPVRYCAGSTHTGVSVMVLNLTVMIPPALVACWTTYVVTSTDDYIWNKLFLFQWLAPTCWHAHKVQQGRLERGCTACCSACCYVSVAPGA